ncbi:hypothetical protein [Aquisediminimonas sediminicola]|uniref:hypothetical protein n=1 Tax=Alteraquisediminimonas sediminicola TaxID=2676787 RepID=UPI001C8D3D11|nr:hypothetical protein [Aquisediminimonas sediminicola]
MELTFAQVERALALTYNIADDKRTAFSARLKHLQKLKFPPGINTGRGRAATYNVGHLFLMGVVLELNQLGLNPERATFVINDDMRAVAQAAAMAARAGPPQNGYENPVLLYLDPACLSDLMIDSPRGDRAASSFFYAGLGLAMESFSSWLKQGMTRIAFFSVSALIYDLASYLSPQTETTKQDFYAELQAWAYNQIDVEDGLNDSNP